MSIKKQALKSKPVCKVTFKLSKAEAAGANEVAVLGDFNEWNPTSDVMGKLKDGSFSHTIELEAAKSYRFRYLADGATWFDEAEADAQEASEFGSANNVLNL
ncbi:MAG TPA: isoamylase early set domain-containing protein [Bacteroidales bacterium]|nr:isoamylase early set domain-containing protein [Bacteroidales bacterium]HQQ12321.1 isoamylase early set domain-containing protein [Bacteroidales bacterium]